MFNEIEALHIVCKGDNISNWLKSNKFQSQKHLFLDYQPKIYSIVRATNPEFLLGVLAIAEI